MFPMFLLRTLVFVTVLSVGLPLVSAQELSPTPCEQRLVTVQEYLADAKAVATQFYLPNMGVQAEIVITLNRKLSESQARETQQVATIHEQRHTLDTVQALLEEAKAQQVNDAVTITGLREELARVLEK